ncbi:hypothetical protein FF1_007235 [Malus domestica]
MLVFLGLLRVKKLEELNTHQKKAASATFTWKFDNFTKLDAIKHYSGAFVIGCFEWGNNNIGYLSLYLDVTGSSTLPQGWARHVRFSLTVINQQQSSKSITNVSHFCKGTIIIMFTSHCLNAFSTLH